MAKRRFWGAAVVLALFGACASPERGSTDASTGVKPPYLKMTNVTRTANAVSLAITVTKVMGTSPFMVSAPRSDMYPDAGQSRVRLARGTNVYYENLDAEDIATLNGIGPYVVQLGKGASDFIAGLATFGGYPPYLDVRVDVWTSISGVNHYVQHLTNDVPLENTVPFGSPSLEGGVEIR